jgi:hypothetical protein
MVNKNDGRYIEVDLNQMSKLCGLQCTKREIASFFNCSEDTIERRLHQEAGVNFSTYYALHSGKGNVALRRKQHDVAMKGNVSMLIWLGKQYLGQKDKHESEVHGSVNINYSDASEENEDD